MFENGTKIVVVVANPNIDLNMIILFRFPKVVQTALKIFNCCANPVTAQKEIVVLVSKNNRQHAQVRLGFILALTIN